MLYLVSFVPKLPVPRAETSPLYQLIPENFKHILIRLKEIYKDDDSLNKCRNKPQNTAAL